MATAWLSSFNPINSFPEYHGPYAVGTVDVEVPAGDLPAVSANPEDAQPTIAFRIFYPCVKPARHDTHRPVRWVPSPQRPTVTALIKFLGLQDRTASALSLVLQQFYWIKLRAHRNAKLRDAPTSNSRWPVTFFSHGLAGSRNAYSYICGDLASNGTIVVAMDHRDGSSPIQYVRGTANSEAHTVPTIKVSHTPNKETWDARDKQLRIRLWEISMAYQALMKIDSGETLENLDDNTSRSRHERVEVLKQFSGALDLHRPGKVSWSGHSFGAATMVQLVKTMHYANERPTDVARPLMVPSADSAILQQITPRSSLLLLDMWGLPLQSPDQAFLWTRPLPSYSPNGPHGENVLAISSEAFYKWKGNLDIVKQAIAGPTSSREAPAAREQGVLLPAWAQLRDHSPSQDSGYASRASRSRSQSPDKSSPDHQVRKSQGPHDFYLEKSQHFNQSDFGILFPWVTKRFANVEEPERILELNTRAMVQVMRQSGIEVAGENDDSILQRESDIRSWICILVGTKSERRSTDDGDLDAMNLELLPHPEDAAPKDSVPVGPGVRVDMET